jgi:hypothetical protein
MEVTTTFFRAMDILFEENYSALQSYCPTSQPWLKWPCSFRNSSNRGAR